MGGMSKEYNAEYYRKNKKRILKNMEEKVKCEICEKTVSRCNMEKHKQTMKHKLKEKGDNENLELQKMNDRITVLEGMLKVFDVPNKSIFDQK